MNCTLLIKNNKMLSVFVLLFVFCGLGSAKRIPSFVHICKRNQPELSKCINSTLFGMLPYMVKGIPEMDISPIDPLGFSTVRVNTGEGRAVSLEIELSNGTLAGLQHMSMEKLEASFDTVRISIAMRMPYVRLQANYQFNGRVMLLDINSRGRCDLNGTDIVLEINYHGSHYTEKGEGHIRFNRIEFVRMDLHNLSLNLEDFSQENRLLIDTVNKALNDNADSIKDDFDVLIKETVGEVFLDYFNRVFRLFPTNELFPVD